MPYKNREKQLKAQSEHYQKNKDAYRERCNAHKRELQKWFQEYKSKLKCSKCHEKHVACLEFHHLDPTQKDFTVGYLAGKGYSKKKILLEIAKCIVLCSNCHKKLHYEARDDLRHKIC